MKILFNYMLCLLVLLTGAFQITSAQEIDLLIKKGHVIDPKNNIDAIMDVAIAGNKIAQVAPNINLPAKKTIDATGLYVSPGFIDIHGHLFFGTQENAYLSNSYTALPPDGFTFRAGVTTIVDAGGAGWRNIYEFKTQTIDHSKTRVLAFINIVGSGMRGGAYEQNLNDMDPKLTSMAALQYKDFVVGIKLAHYSGHEWIPTERTVEAGKLARIPVMIDFGGATPPLPLKTLLLEKLRPGDIFTHCYGKPQGRMSVVEDGKLQPYTLEAQKKGIVFDVGHGGGSFLFSQAIPAIQQGLKPNSISTDLHTGSMNGGMKDMANVMSKMLNIGLTINEVIRFSTWNPATYINRPDLGHLSPGAPADVTLFSIAKGDFGFLDVGGNRQKGDKKIECQLTVRDGTIVWDLNALAGK